MTITRDIVLDLLPLYAAGEASPDSRAAVDAFVAADASVARLCERCRTSRRSPRTAPSICHRRSSGRR